MQFQLRQRGRASMDFAADLGGALIHGELIHPLYVARNFPGQIFRQRTEVLKELGPRRLAKRPSVDVQA